MDLSTQCITTGGSTAPQWTYHVSQRECRLLQRVQNLPAALSCSPLSLVGAWDDFVSVPPIGHQELWTGNCYQNKNADQNLLKMNLGHLKQWCSMLNHPWKSSTQRKDKASTLTVHDSSQIPREGSRGDVQPYYLHKGQRTRILFPIFKPADSGKSLNFPGAGDTQTTWTQSLDVTGHVSPKGSDSWMLFQR